MQVESFMLLLLQLTLPALKANAHLHIVEFGSGSGNLVLPLAHLFPCFTFTAVDMKASAIALLGQRVQQCQMHNVRVREGTIELYSGECNIYLMQRIHMPSMACSPASPPCNQSCRESTHVITWVIAGMQHASHAMQYSN